ncbi:MAG: polysaccharide biosynthesis/export family protein [Leptolyngbyaceae cyanobacterium]
MKPIYLSTALLSIIAVAMPVQAQLPEISPIEQAAASTSSRSIPLKVGDRLTITVADFPDLSGEHVVTADGTIQVPLVGDVSVIGLTPSQVSPYLSGLLLPYVRRPQVVVSGVTFSPLRISVTGAVVQPGPRLLNTEQIDADGQVTLSETLVMAGGITPEADLRNITIRRPTNDISGQKSIQVNLWEVIQSGQLSADPEILDGDEVIVPKSESTTVDQRTLLASTVAPQQITIHVAGEVERPGQIDITPSADISAAVAAAGGLTVDADDDDVALFRMQPSGQLAQESFAFGEASTTLMHGDLIVVKASNQGGVGDTFDFIGRLLNPLGALFRILD